MKKVTNADFEQEVLQSEIPVLVDFFATWCMPCKMFAPVLEEVSEEREGALKVVKLDVEEAPELAVKYRVMSIPTLKLFQNGEVKESFVGAMSKEELSDWLERSI